MIKHLTKTLKRQFEPIIELIIRVKYLENIIIAIGYSIRLWLMTLVFPVMLTILLIFLSILGEFDKFSLDFWRHYYYDGYLCGFVAWRIHLGLLFMLFLYMINKVSEESFG